MIKIHVAELLEGMTLAEAVLCPKTEKKLINQRTKLTAAMINNLRQRGVKYVTVIEPNTVLVDPSEITAKEMGLFMHDLILKLAPDRAEANKSDKMITVSRLARSISTKLLENKQLVDLCLEMKILENGFLYRHAVGTCVLCLLVAGAMDLEQDEMFKIATAALLHDLGWREMPTLLHITKRSPQEEALWREHPTYGYYIAKENDFSHEVTKLILHHHENWDGSGFPNGLSAKNIPLGARIISVCEIYDRLIGHEGYAPYQAIEYLYGSGNYSLDAEIVRVFTENLAVYPLGSLVRLSTGEVGVVVNIRKNQGPRPVVQVYFNRVNRPLKIPKFIDLGKERTLFIQQVL
ncbi:MAG: HD domain-containing phosphohydrolase [Bacillota bacterium]